MCDRRVKRDKFGLQLTGPVGGVVGGAVAAAVAAADCGELGLG
jgi:hypothetical protein